MDGEAGCWTTRGKIGSPPNSKGHGSGYTITKAQRTNLSESQTIDNHERRNPKVLQISLIEQTAYLFNSLFYGVRCIMLLVPVLYK